MLSFKRGTEWPNEGFVQTAIETFFRSGGFDVIISSGVLHHLADPRPA